MATSLEEMIAKLNQNSTKYTPLTDEQMRQQAQNRYQSVYDQNRLTANQQYQTSDQALAQHLAGLQANYDKQREQSAKNYREAYSQADRHALSRGMQRSSYNNATLANIRLAGNKAQDEIGATQAAQEKNIGEQRALLSQQLAAQLAQYDKSQQADILAYVDELEAREYDRTTANQNTQNQLAMQIYEYQHQLEQEAEDKRRWELEYNAAYGGTSRRSGGGTRKASSGSTGSYNDFVTALDKQTNKNTATPGGKAPGKMNAIYTNRIMRS